MRAKLSFILFILIFVFSSDGIWGLEVHYGGKLVEVVAADSGYTDSTIATKFEDGWYSKGPTQFDVDKDGNIYILDRFDCQVQKYDNTGKWVFSFSIPGKRTKKNPSGKCSPYMLGDITVDNWGNIYVDNFKFSPQGKLLFKCGGGQVLLTDRTGRLYSFQDQFSLVNIYGLEGRRDGRIDRLEKDLHLFDYYWDLGIVQNEVGDDIYFRENKYLVRTSFEEYSKDAKVDSTGRVIRGKIDTVAVLPDIIRVKEFYDNLKDPVWEENPFTFIGFDRNSNFYFVMSEFHYGPKRLMRACRIYRLRRYHLEDGELTKTGEVEVAFAKGTEECSDKELFEVSRAFKVSGDGTIYWLHGTVDKVKVSKIIFDE